MGATPKPSSRPVCKRFAKETYSRSEAKSAAKRMQRNGKGNIQAYLCKACHGWHIGRVRKFA